MPYVSPICDQEAGRPALSIGAVAAGAAEAEAEEWGDEKEGWARKVGYAGRTERLV